MCMECSFTPKSLLCIYSTNFTPSISSIFISSTLIAVSRADFVNDDVVIIIPFVHFSTCMLPINSLITAGPTDDFHFFACKYIFLNPNSQNLHVILQSMYWI